MVDAHLASSSSIVGPWRDRNSWRVGARARLVVVGMRLSGVVRTAVGARRYQVMH
jgi:hypothetical protein